MCRWKAHHITGLFLKTRSVLPTSQWDSGQSPSVLRAGRLQPEAVGPGLLQCLRWFYGHISHTLFAIKNKMRHTSHVSDCKTHFLLISFSFGWASLTLALQRRPLWISSFVLFFFLRSDILKEVKLVSFILGARSRYSMQTVGEGFVSLTWGPQKTKF